MISAYFRLIPRLDNFLAYAYCDKFLRLTDARRFRSSFYRSMSETEEISRPSERDGKCNKSANLRV